MFSLAKTSEHRPHGFLFGSEKVDVDSNHDLRLSMLRADPEVCRAACPAGGLFSSSALEVPAIQISMEHLARNRQRAWGVLVHAGIANVGTGLGGNLDAKTLLDKVSEATATKSEEWLLAGTGWMGSRLPVADVCTSIPSLSHQIKSTGIDNFARGIQTTDRSIKVASGSGVSDGRTIRILGVAKGNRMVHPRLCTMLVFLVTDANLSATALNAALQETKTNFEGISVDGVSSPSDSVFALANGAVGGDPMEVDSDGYRVVRAGMTAVCQSLCSQIVEDGSTATSKVRRAQVTISSAPTHVVAHRVVDSLATNFLLKEALAQGRSCFDEVIAAVSTANCEIDFNRISIALDTAILMKRGQPCAPSPDQLNQLFAKPLASIRVDLGAGSSTVTRWISSGPALRFE